MIRDQYDSGDPLIAAVKDLVIHVQGAGSYCIAYGSHASDLHRPTSDLDILQVASTRPTPEQERQLRDSVVRLHHEHGLKLDTEVRYDVKLVATHDEVHAAIWLEAFPDPVCPGSPIATPVPSDPDYLNSLTFKHRLILNALTSPNIFLGGDLRTFEHHTHAAERSLALLSMRIQAAERYPAQLEGFTLTQALNAILYGPGGSTGEDYLGYRPSRALLGTLNRGLHRLLDAKISVSDSGHAWRPGPAWADRRHQPPNRDILHTDMGVR